MDRSSCFRQAAKNQQHLLCEGSIISETELPISLNLGPFNLKEHALITILANAGSYAVSIVTINPMAAFLLNQITQDEDEGEEEDGGLSKSEKELKKTFGKAAGLNESDTDDDDEEVDVSEYRHLRELLLKTAISIPK